MPEIIPNLHPVFVHFTVALLSISVALFVLLFLLGKWLPHSLSEQWRAVARWNLWLGAGVTLLTVTAGFYAYNTVAHDAPSHAAMTVHRNWAIATVTLITGLAAWSIIQLHAGRHLGGLFVGALLVFQLVLLSTAWHGGELVYRYGLGVISLPQPEGNGHTHSGAGAHDLAESTGDATESHSDDDHPNDNSISADVMEHRMSVQGSSEDSHAH